MSTKVLFLCPHGAAKSVMAKAYFNQFARQQGLTVAADAAGTEPDAVVAPIVVEMLNREGLDVSQHQPRHVTAEDLKSAQRIISMGCSPEELGVSTERIEQWNDIPPVSQNPDSARTIIRDHVEQLVTELQRHVQSS